MNLSSARVTADPVSTSMSHLTPPTESSTIRGLDLRGPYDDDGKSSVSSTYFARTRVTGGSLAFPADVVQSTACPATSVATFIWPASLLMGRSLRSRRSVGRQQFL
ncbi:hypothetical protein T11_13487 [Trichinella zimbabwensis]|uniref:Uncharacterized protein n=1 Tax=Trichinella zimbabwensis TaxID=268475 RepID=A0A0V1H5A3_9BILA|nr:hypothetical protein T11_13487 [Trichinella zimbabwensis]